MKDYQLKEDEVVLFKGDIELQGVKGKTELIFTNHNFVFINKQKKLLGEEDVEVEIYPVTDVKIYEKKPQIKVKELNVEIYFLRDEKTCIFSSEEDVNEFMNEAQKLLTHKTIAEKGAQKVKDGINLVNETLNVDIVHSTGNLINNVATKFVGGFANKASDVAQGILKFGKGLFKKKK